jgi:hypothetical protein
LQIVNKNSVQGHLPQVTFYEPRAKKKTNALNLKIKCFSFIRLFIVISSSAKSKKKIISSTQSAMLEQHTKNETRGEWRKKILYTKKRKREIKFFLHTSELMKLPSNFSIQIWRICPANQQEHFTICFKTPKFFGVKIFFFFSSHADIFFWIAFFTETFQTILRSKFGVVCMNFIIFRTLELLLTNGTYFLMGILNIFAQILTFFTLQLYLLLIPKKSEWLKKCLFHYDFTPVLSPVYKMVSISGYGKSLCCRAVDRYWNNFFCWEVIF